MARDPKVEGRSWADRVYQEKLSTRDLPNLGRGYPDEYRAAYAVRQIAEKKLYFGRDATGGGRVRSDLRRDEVAFWRSVLDRANELCLAVDEVEPNATERMKTMETPYRPNLARKLRRLPDKFSRYPEVSVMTTEVVLHMIKQEHGLPAEAVRSAQDALTEGLEEDSLELVEKAWSLLPERHQDDPVVPWIAKQINAVMKAIDAHDRDKAARVLEELGECPEGDWLEVLVDVLKLRAAALARWARGSGGDLGRRTLQQALDAMGAA